MGYSLSWVAVKDGNPQAVCAALGLRATGKYARYAKSKIAGAQLPTGWYVVLFDRKEVQDGVLARLSLSGEVVCCYVEDHVMVSWASGWRVGKKIWSVVHENEKGPLHLDIKGQAPDELKGTAEGLTAKQRAAGDEDVDYVYDVPAELLKQLTGFRHDQDTQGLSGDAFEILEQATKPLGLSASMWLFLSTPIAALLYLLSVALFGKYLPYWATAAPGSVVMLALTLHVLISLLIVKIRSRRKDAGVAEAAEDGDQNEEEERP